MEKCSPRCLAISLIFFGCALLWFGINSSSRFISSPAYMEPIQEATQSSQLGIKGERVLVSRVIDGDTIELEDGRKVRYIGVDTPETKDPRRAVECFGKEAALENKNLVEGKVVFLQNDISETDKYNRLLKYVYLPLEDGSLLFINDYLIREGFAYTLTYPPDVKYTEQFLEAQQQAKIKRKGLWKKC